MADLAQRTGIITDGYAGSQIQAGNALSGSSPNYSAGVTAYSGLITSTEGTKPTYSAACFGLVPASSATDIFVLNGSASKTIRLLHVWVSGTAGTAINCPIVLYRRTALDTGGTAATSTALPVGFAHDSNSPAFTATVSSYTANPTITSAGSGILRAQYLLLATSAAAAAAGNPCVEWDFTTRNDQAPVLRGAAQCFAINLGSTSVSTGSLNIEVEWTEE